MTQTNEMIIAHNTNLLSEARDYLNLAKCKKRTGKKIRRAVKQQLQYVRWDLGYVDALLSDGVELSPRQHTRLTVLKQVYGQQQYMYENNVHSVSDRIASTSQPYIRTIVRGKAAYNVYKMSSQK